MSKEIATLSKEEISIKLNDLLGTEGIDFSPMKKDDLIKLYDMLSGLLRPFSDMSLREILDEALGDKSDRFGQHVRARLRSCVKEFLEKREAKGEA